MSVLAAPRSGADLLEEMFADAPAFAYAGLAMLVLTVPTVMALALDTRLFQGGSPWVKPLKFELSIALFLLSLAFFARYLPDGMTARADYRIYAAIVVVCAVAEMIWIGGAAAFATASHYNSGPIMAQIYGVMGVLAVILTSAALVFGVAMLRSGSDRPLVSAIGLSLVLTFVLTVIIGFRLAGNGGHFVGVPALGHALPVLGWSMEVGDLRVAHFFATHAMHFIPAAVLAIALLAPALATHVMAGMLSLAYAVFTVAVFVQALGGRPFIAA